MRQNLGIMAAVILSILLGPSGVLGEARADDAELIVLVGDIDNLGFGFPVGFDVFSGASTSRHAYPFQPELSDPGGTDRIMVGTSYTGNSPSGIDGYTRTTSRPENLPQPIEVTYNTGSVTVRAAIIQMFVDDFQAVDWSSSFQARLNGRRAAFMEDVLNALNQTGPIGKLISLPVPAEFLPVVTSGDLSIAIDDPTTGTGDGFAIDFVRLLINPTLSTHVGTITGTVIDKDTGTPLAGATVSAGGAFSALSGMDGGYVLNDIPAGLAVLTASAQGYVSQTATVDLLSDGTATLDFELVAGGGTAGELILQHLFNAGVNLGWAHIHSFWRFYGSPPILNPPDGPTTETEIITDLNQLKAHLTASGFPFSNYTASIDDMVASLQRNEDSLYVPTACARLLSDLQAQIGEASCQLETGEVIEIQHLFNAGVNLGWAHIHSFWRFYGSPPILNPPDGPTTETEIITDLNWLDAHLTASGFPFTDYEGPIDDMVASLQRDESSLYVPTGCARLLSDLQDQLDDATCQGQGGTLGNLLVVTSEARLSAKFGQQGYDRIIDALGVFNVTLLDVTADDYATIDGQIEEIGASDINTILIIGGDDIVPFAAMSNPKKDQDILLLTDDVYADFDHDAKQIIDVPIARIPDGGELDVVLTQLSARANADTGAFALANRNRPFATQIAQIIGATTLWSAPTRPFDISQAELQVPFAYFMLHGSGSSGARWYGELGTSDNWAAIEAFNASDAASQGVVLSGACYGAKIINFTPANSICLAFLRSGARAFVGSTAITYSHMGDGSNRLGGLFHRLFLENLTSGQTPLRAFFNTKRSFGSNATTPIEHKLSHIFVFYGRP